MKYVASESELELLFRNLLIEQSEIPEKFVRAQRSLYGTMLDKNRGDMFDSIEHSNLLILFEIHTSSSINNISETQTDGLKHFSFFEVHVIIYGDESVGLANKLTARLRSEDVKDFILSNGVKIIEVESPQETKEFKNGTIWIRNDFDMSIGCTMLIEPVKPSHSTYVDELNKITVQTL